MSFLFIPHSVQYLLVITTETRQTSPLMNPFVHMNPVILKSSSSQKPSVCKLDRDTKNTVASQIPRCSLAVSRPAVSTPHRCAGLPRWHSGQETFWSGGDLGDAGSIPESGRSPGEADSNSLQHSCLGNPMDRGAWWATVHGVARSQNTTEHERAHGMTCLQKFWA